MSLVGRHRLVATCVILAGPFSLLSFCVLCLTQTWISTLAIRFSTFPKWFGWLGSRVVIVLDSGAAGPGFKSQPRRCRVKVLGKLFTPAVPLFTKQRNW